MGYFEVFNSKLKAECLRSYGANAPVCRLDRLFGFSLNWHMSEPMNIQTLTRRRAEIFG